MGGSDDPSNLIELTIEEHAKAHYELWLICGCWEDEIAYLGLTGQIGKDEIIRKCLIESGRKRMRKLHESDPDFRHRLGKAAAAAQIGIPKTEDHKKKMRGRRPHVNQSGGKNNNAKSLITPFGEFGSISELLNKYGDEIPGSGTGKYRYIHKMIKNNIWSTA